MKSLIGIPLSPLTMLEMSNDEFITINNIESGEEDRELSQEGELDQVQYLRVSSKTIFESLIR